MSNGIPKRVLVVTGASSGIGREVARLAPSFGFDVLAVARRGERLNALAQEIAAQGGRCATVAIDVRAAAAPKAIVDAAMREFGRIDVLFNNAGSGAPGPLLEQTDAAIAAQWELHVAAPLRITRAALPALAQSGGQVLFVGSGLARVPAPGFGAYAPAKAAVRAAAIQLRRELRPQGVAVTYVDPGAVDTEFSEASGMERSSSDVVVSPQKVARRILQATQKRPRRVNAVPWQTLFVTLGEWFPALADAAIARVVDKPKPPATTVQDDVAAQEPILEPERVKTASPFEAALEPVARRMERVKLPATFLAQELRPGNEVHLSDLAMRWAGMPNKNERAAMAEALEALATGGFLQKTGEETWIVVRSAE